MKDTRKIRCLMFKEGKCNSDYNKESKCDGINPPKNCPYLEGKIK